MTFALHNFMTFIKSVFNKNQNHYYYNIFLEKCSYQLDENNGNKYYTQVFVWMFA